MDYGKVLRPYSVNYHFKMQTEKYKIFLRLWRLETE